MAVYRSLADCWVQMAQAPSLALDIETTGLSPYNDRIAVVQLATPEGDVLVDHTAHTGISPQLCSLLSEPKNWITQNGTNFDLLFLIQENLPPPGDHYDVLIGESVLNTQARHDRKKDLGSIMHRRLGRSYKGEITHSWLVPELSDEQVDYCVEDVRWLHDIRRVQEDLAKERQLGYAMHKEQQLTKLVSKISSNGMALNEQVLEERKVTLLEEAEESRERIKGVLPGVNLNSPKQVVEALNSINIPVANAQAKTFEAWKGRWPILGDILVVKRADKRADFYDDEWVEKFVKAGRVRSLYYQIGAETGRFTARDPNLQQIPRNMRGIFGNEPGYCVIQADYGQIEVRIAAFYSRDQDLMQAFYSEDLHSFMAQTMFPDKEIDKEWRSKGKHGTFTWVFAGGAKAIKAKSEEGGMEEALSLEESQEVLNQLRRRFVGMRKWHSQAAAQSRGGGAKKLTLPWGHHRLFPPGQATPQRWCNTRIQGSAAIGFKEALFCLEADGLLDYVGGLVHDEIVATSVPEAYADEYRVAMVAAMQRGMNNMLEEVMSHSRIPYEKVPIVVDSTVGAAWS